MQPDLELKWLTLYDGRTQQVLLPNPGAKRSRREIKAKAETEALPGALCGHPLGIFAEICSFATTSVAVISA